MASTSEHEAAAVLRFDAAIAAALASGTAPEATQKRVVESIAQTGLVYFPWKDVKPVVLAQLGAVLDRAHATYADCPAAPEETFDAQKTRVLSSLDEFDQAPFTIQRICELIQEPHRVYKSTNKLLGALDKLTAVSSTQPMCKEGEEHLQTAAALSGFDDEDALEPPPAVDVERIPRDSLAIKYVDEVERDPPKEGEADAEMKEGEAAATGDAAAE